jgi:hypothetical protein
MKERDRERRTERETWREVKGEKERIRGEMKM